MIKNGHVINNVIEGSIASELEIEAGDILLSVNGEKISDIFDYHYLINDNYINIIIRKSYGEEWELEIEKEYGEDIGIEFSQSLMDEYKSCRNKCIFCFIDQMPPGMRETLYFKDDDARLSFLQGNYITLTNMSDEDIDRIILYKMAPVNISVHTTNPELRCKMLNNRFAGEAIKKVRRLYEAGIEMNSQIVLCKGYNDGEELDNTIRELSQFLPYMMSLSVVPVGMTKYRENLTKLEKFNRQDSIKVINQIESWQKELLSKHDTRFVHPSDEWYITAGIPIPNSDFYEGYGQIENGVGMVRSLTDEVEEYIDNKNFNAKIKKHISIATGVLAAPIIEKLVKVVNSKYPNIDINIYKINNNFFGHDITVAGLLTGQDIIEQLKCKDLGQYLILPSVILRSGEEVLLDDVTIDDIKKALQTEIRIVKSDGKSFVETIIN